MSVKFLYCMVTVFPLLNASHQIQLRHKGRGVKLHDLEGRIATNLWTRRKHHFIYLFFYNEIFSNSPFIFFNQLFILSCDPMDCSLPGSFLHGILQARVLEWVAISFSRGSFRPRDRTQVSRISGRCFNL